MIDDYKKIAHQQGLSYDNVIGAGFTDEDVKWYADRKAKASAAKAPAEPIVQPVQPQTEQPDRTFLGTLGDAGVTAGHAVVDTGEAVMGLANMATGGNLTPVYDAVGYDPKTTHEIISKGYSPAQQWANKQVESAKGFGGTVQAYAENPSNIVTGIGRTVPMMLAGGGIAKGVGTFLPKLFPKVSTGVLDLAAIGLGEGALQAGSMAEGVRQEKGDLSWADIGYSTASGAGTGLLTALSGGLARKLGIADVESYLADIGTKVGTKLTPAQIAKGILGGGITEGVFEEMPQSMQETMWMNVSMGKPVMDGVPESAASGLVLGGLMGGGFNAATPALSNDQSKFEDALTKQFNNIKENGLEKMPESINALSQKIVQNTQLLQNEETLQALSDEKGHQVDDLKQFLVSDNEFNQELIGKLNIALGKPVEQEVQAPEDIETVIVNQQAKPDESTETTQTPEEMVAEVRTDQTDQTPATVEEVVTEQAPEIAEAPASPFIDEQQVAEQSQVAELPIDEEVASVPDASEVDNQQLEQEQITLPEANAEFQAAETAQKPTKVSLPDIESMFPNQQVVQAEDGSVAVKFKNGKGVTFKSIQDAGQGFIKMAIETGQMSENGKILGITVGSEVLLDANYADNQTMWHENKHVLDNLGMVTSTDNSALNAEFNKLRKSGKLGFELSTHENAVQRMKENRANMFAQVMTDRSAYRGDSKFKAMIQRVTDFIKQMLAFGQQSVSGLAREAESGALYERQAPEQASDQQTDQADFNAQNDSVASKALSGLLNKKTDVTTPEFAEWFEQSVAKKPDGTPLELYHGTDQVFEVFSKDSVTNTGHTTAPLGHFFTLKKGIANAYGQHTLPVYLKMNKPYKMSLEEAQALPTQAASEQRQQELRDEGYDSIIMETGTSPYVIVFDSGQAKSVYNQGEFKSPDNIYFETREGVKDGLGLSADILKNDKGTVSKEVVSKISERLQVLKDAGYPVDVKFTSVGKSVPTEMARGSKGLTISDKDGATVWLHGEDVVEGGSDNITAVHELSHAALTQLIKYGSSADAKGTQVAKDVEDLFTVTNEIVDNFNERVRRSQRSQSNRNQLPPFLKKIFKGEVNALHDKEEVLAWALTDSRFQSFLREMPSGVDREGKPQSMWDRLVNKIRKVLGIPAEEATALNVVLSVGESLLDSKKVGQTGASVERQQVIDKPSAQFQTTEQAAEPTEQAAEPTEQAAEPTEQKLSDKQYEKAFNEKNNLVQSIWQTAKIRGHEAKLLADKLTGSISTRLANVNPLLRNKMRRLDFDTSQSLMKALNTAKPLLEKTKEMTPADKHAWDLARKQADTVKLNQIATRYGMLEDQEKLRTVMNDIRQQARDVGYDVGFIDDYWPRIIKDTEGFLQETQGISERPVFTEALKDKAKQMGISIEELNSDFPDVRADVISNLILGQSSGINGPGNIQGRVFDEIPKGLEKFYMDSDAALMQYIYSMTKKIEARKFFGKVPPKIQAHKQAVAKAQAELVKLDGIDPAREVELNDSIALHEEAINKFKNQRDYTENIGAYIDELMITGELSSKDERVVRDILNARFNEHGTTGAVNAYKNLAYIDVMGNPISALTQIGDLAWAAYVGKAWTPKGFSRTVKNVINATLNKSKMKKEDLGLERIAQEFADGTTLGNAVSNVFKMVGLTKMDSIGKEALINNALQGYQEQVKSPEGITEIEKKIRPIFGPETKQVIKDLATGTHSENVKMLVYSRLLDFQPAALSEMSEQYLKGGNGRVFYMLKTYTLKQMDVFRNEVFAELKSGDPKRVAQGMKNMTALLSMLTLANAGADELKDFILGKETSFKDNVVENFLTIGGASRYMQMQVNREGIGSAMLQKILPPVKFIDSASSDIRERIVSGELEKGVRSLDSVPVIGKLAYWHLGRGSENKKSLNEKDFSKAGKKFKKFKQKAEKSGDARLFYQANVPEFRQMQLHKNMQTSLNGLQATINKLEKLEQTPNVVKRVGQLENQQESYRERYFEVAKTLEQ